jgi:hypothetical protein
MVDYLVLLQSLNEDIYVLLFNCNVRPETLCLSRKFLNNS